MTSDQPGGRGLNCRYCNAGKPAGKMHRIVLWLSAICIASFVMGFGVLALSGTPFIQDGFSVMPINDTVFHSPETSVIPMDGITRAEIAIKYGTGDLKVNARADDDVLLQSTAYTKGPEGKPVITVVSSGLSKSVDIEDTEPNGNSRVGQIFPKYLGISLNSKVPLVLSVRSVAGDTSLDLGSLNLTALTINAGAGDIDVDLSNYKGSAFTGRVSHHAGDLTIRVPKEANVTIALDQGFGHISNKGLVMEHGSYSTVVSNPAQPKILLSVEQGAGSVNLEAV
jgi:hypothetical protein